MGLVSLELKKDVTNLKYLFVTQRSAEAMNVCTAQWHIQKPAQNNCTDALVYRSKYLKKMISVLYELPRFNTGCQ